MGSNFKFNGKTTVVAGFPAIGKTYAREFCFTRVPGIDITDFDVIEFKDNVTNRNLTNDQLNELYVRQLKSLIESNEVARMSDPWGDEIAKIIFVCGDDVFRKLMSDAGIKFMYIAPKLDCLPAMQEVIQERLDSTDDSKYYNRSLDAKLLNYLKSDEAKKSIERTTAGKDPFPGQGITYLIDMGKNPADVEEYGDKAIFHSVLEFVIHNTEFSGGFQYKHKMTTVQATELSDLMEDYGSNASSRMAIYTGMTEDAEPKFMNHSGGYLHQYGMDSYGRIIHIANPMNFWDTYNSMREDSDEKALAPEFMAHIGHFGLDSFVVPKKCLIGIVGLLRADISINEGEPTQVYKHIIDSLDDDVDSDTRDEYTHACETLFDIVGNKVYPLYRAATMDAEALSDLFFICSKLKIKQKDAIRLSKLQYYMPDNTIVDILIDELGKGAKFAMDNPSIPVAKKVNKFMDILAKLTEKKERENLPFPDVDDEDVDDDDEDEEDE